MQRNRINRRSVQRQRRNPRYGYRRCRDRQSRRCQSRHVQGLAHVAGCFRATGVRVKEGATASEIQYCRASQQRQGALQMLSSGLAQANFHVEAHSVKQLDHTVPSQTLETPDWLPSLSDASSPQCRRSSRLLCSIFAKGPGFLIPPGDSLRNPARPAAGLSCLAGSDSS
jgi:hypothetical protein